MGFGFYVTTTYCPAYYAPYYVAEPVFVAPPVVEQTVVVPPTVVYPQTPVYAQPYAADGAYVPSNQGAYDGSTGGSGVVSTDAPAGVGDVGQNVSAQPQQVQQQAVQQQAAQPQPQQASRQASPSGGTLSGEQLYQKMSDGTQQFSQGAYEEAAKQFLDVTMQDPSNVDASLAYAVARFATGDYAVSAVAIRRGIARLPDIVNSAFDIRDRYGNQADLERHLQNVSDFLRSHPDNMDAVVVLGFVQHFTGQREGAKDTFTQLRRLSPSDAQLADTFLNAKPLPEAPAQAPTGNGQAVPQGGQAAPQGGSQTPAGSSQPMSGQMPQSQNGGRLVNSEIPQEQAVPAGSSPSYLDNALSGYTEVLE